MPPLFVAIILPTKQSQCGHCWWLPTPKWWLPTPILYYIYLVDPRQRACRFCTTKCIQGIAFERGPRTAEVNDDRKLFARLDARNEFCPANRAERITGGINPDAADAAWPSSGYNYGIFEGDQNRLECLFLGSKGWILRRTGLKIWTIVLIVGGLGESNTAGLFYGV